MTSPPSSSNRAGGVCDAVLVKDAHHVGPMRLPLNRADDFVEHFNRIYAAIGMQLAPVEEVTNKKIPGSPKAAGDDSFG